MRIRYIFISRKEDIEKDEEHKHFLNLIFSEVNNNTFKLNDIDGFVNYSASYELYEKKGFVLEVEYGKNNKKDADIASIICNKIIQGKHREKYKIIIIYDEVSMFFCKKGFVEIAKWEHKLRELIYRILVKSYGANWLEKTFSEEFIESCHRPKSQLVECGLQELSIGQLERLLFDPYSNCDLNELLINGEFSETNIKNKDATEIIDKLNECRPKSVWERFFNDVKIKDFKDNLSMIREYRNKIAHNKKFYNDEYIIFKKLINNMTKEIDKAILDINKPEFEIKLNDLAKVGKYFYNFVQEFGVALSSINQTIIRADIEKKTNHLLHLLGTKK